MSSCIKPVLFVLFLLFFDAEFSFGQKKNDLENKKKSLQKEIQVTEGLLNETKQNKKISLNQLVTLNKKISIREELIQTINAEMRLLQKQINENKGIIEALESDIKALKQEYANMIYYANKNKNSYDRLMFIFSSKDFNQAYKRLKYLQQYSEYRKKQAEMIVKTQTLLDKKIADLEAIKNSKQQLLGSEEQEKRMLADEKKEQEGTLSKLQEKEKELLQALKEKEKEQNQLQLAIQRIIEEEIRKAKETAAKAGKVTPKGLVLTPEALELSATFANNKAKLPWPVIEGIITSKFGEHAHPVLKGIMIRNNGVDITTATGSSVRAVFDGEVTGIATLPTGTKFVIVRHGEYLSVYSNLKEVFVNKGDKIITKQNIGKVFTDDSNSKSEVHLEIYKGSIALNPELWLFKNN
ncbi:MAG: peptidoglycan DD-metalloendopeptidase family protein [Bacteroidetes bacterium]|nr:peptidoglycan DD-metalloendopeptidase family protein [Bacteroidota bacterium]HET6245394.1 peptidoglycan DD-metalloendopeptidase family protein [Bacteroidia bacterium]